MDIFTKGALWDLLKMGGDEIKDLMMNLHDHEDTGVTRMKKLAKIFKIETDWRKDGYCNRGNLLRSLPYLKLAPLAQDLNGNKDCEDSEQKDKAFKE
ncbi:hypothetical protein Tco_1238802 [Tanacetum coccineum]